jgi:hypothetical protein
MPAWLPILGDLVAEWITFAAPLVVFGQKIFGGWVVDYNWRTCSESSFDTSRSSR